MELFFCWELPWGQWGVVITEFMLWTTCWRPGWLSILFCCCFASEITLILMAVWIGFAATSCSVELLVECGLWAGGRAGDALQAQSSAESTRAVQGMESWKSGFKTTQSAPNDSDLNSVRPRGQSDSTVLGWRDEIICFFRCQWLIPCSLVFPWFTHRISIQSDG